MAATLDLQGNGGTTTERAAAQILGEN